MMIIIIVFNNYLNYLKFTGFYIKMSTEITDDHFIELLEIISEWYEKLGYTNMLKVLYRDLVRNKYELNNATTVREIMDLLTSSGNLAANDFNLLYDTINITQQYGLRGMIKHVLPASQEFKDVIISKFKPHRLKVMKFGMVLNKKDLKKISGLYNTPAKEYADTWSLIMDLEHRKIMYGKMKAFIRKLKTFKLRQAVDALTEGGVEFRAGPSCLQPSYLKKKKKGKKPKRISGKFRKQKSGIYRQ
ncbi:uncharacterized protein LOC117111124 [Anneissia japonica]|uniref:uncharacterized protein LOC117111124 n=1 Tax=Anneissia japonica TaxID=1529436 RepID=UPI0014259D87|nr:uncharacterized protein LOC117111124 [Anneissia japonica]